jgi:hypothetical protein
MKHVVPIHWDSSSVSPFGILIVSNIHDTLSDIRDTIISQFTGVINETFELTIEGLPFTKEQEPLVSAGDIFQFQQGEYLVLKSAGDESKPKVPNLLSADVFLVEQNLPNFTKMKSVQPEEFLDTLRKPTVSATSSPRAESKLEVRTPASRKGSMIGKEMTPKSSYLAPEMAANFLESELNDGIDFEFLDRLDQALDKDLGDSLKISVMDPKGRFVMCETLQELNQILDFCKHEDITLAQAKNQKKKKERENVMWIDLEGCNIQEIVAIGERLDIHPLTVEDLTQKEVRQKLEPFDKYIFVVLYSLHHDFYAGTDRQNVIKILVFANLVVSLHFYPSFAVNLARSRLRKVGRLLKDCVSHEFATTWFENAQVH